MRKILTLCIIHDHPRVLLGMKKKGFGAGRWNGFGGKVEPGESIEQAAKREVQEESGLEAIDMERFGILEFEFQQGEGENANAALIHEVHIFKVRGYVGELTETDEMKPQWFFVDELPFKDMWPSDLYWLPLLLKGRKFEGTFVLDKPSTPEYQSKIIDRKLALVDEI